MLFLGVGNLNGLLAIIIAIMIGPSLLLLIIGLAIRKNKSKTAKVLFILAVLDLIISFGICGSMMT